LGMEVLAVDPYVDTVNLDLKIGGQNVGVSLTTVDMDKMLGQADIISLHIPFLGKAVIGTEEFSKMKDGMVIINCARGGTIDESALLTAMDSGKVAAAGLDVFENEPNPRRELLEHPNISLTPHIGASTGEAQENIGIELAEQIIAYFK